jgi:hypothetical protein
MIEKTTLTILAIFALTSSLLVMLSGQEAQGAHYAGKLSGYILLQVEKNGEAWYVFPSNGKKYYLDRPKDAFAIMKGLSLGAKSDYINNTIIFPERLSGMILLDVEKNGEAYYIYPRDMKKYYLGRPADAFSIMQKLSLGVTNADLANIPIGVPGEPMGVFDSNQSFFIDKVPFMSQAPFGDWQDQRFQDGCEEASALMAIKWVRGESLPKQEASDTILKISDFLQEKYKEYRDISSRDAVNWIFKDYFKHKNVFLVHEITVADIINELSKGNLVITPMDGQIMHNPNYRLPGPPRHMIVIRGYDYEKKVFITNDPGTRNGELYRYDAKVLYEAIRDYPTGYHELITRIEKNMIVVGK